MDREAGTWQVLLNGSPDWELWEMKKVAQPHPSPAGADPPATHRAPSGQSPPRSASMCILQVLLLWGLDLCQLGIEAWSQSVNLSALVKGKYFQTCRLCHRVCWKSPEQRQIIRGQLGESWLAFPLPLTKPCVFGATKNHSSPELCCLLATRSCTQGLSRVTTVNLWAVLGAILLLQASAVPGMW